MRHIPKECFAFKPLERANLVPPQTSQDARARWKEFRWYKKKLLKILLAEQFYVCCYSEICAENYDFRYHIEHILNKGEHPLLTFDYANLAASALADDDLTRLRASGGNTLFGGHALGKSKSVNTRLFISPHVKDCDRFFAYLSDGRVVPAEELDKADKERATHTINELNLNSQFLVQQRKSWSDELCEIVDRHLLDSESLNRLCTMYLTPHQQKLMSFYSLTRQILSRG